MQQRRLRGLGLAASLALAAVAGPVSIADAHGVPGGGDGVPGGLSPENRKLLHEVRDATAAYRDVHAAEAAGYETTGTCAADPKLGGMGVHYGNPRLMDDDVIDPLKPELLVYQPTWYGELRLGAVEYFQPDADGDLATDDDRPSVFDLPFDGPMLGHEPGMPVHYDLHAWLYRHNPAGLFAPFNPRVACPSLP